MAFVPTPRGLQGDAVAARLLWPFLPRPWVEDPWREGERASRLIQCSVVEDERMYATMLNGNGDPCR